MRIHFLPRPAATTWAVLAWAVAGRALTWLAAFRPAAKAHRYTSCRNRDCDRVPCLAYREGYDDGYLDGYAAGRADGGDS